MRNEVEKYIIYGLALVLIYLSFLVVKPYFAVICAGLIFGYIFYPLFKKVNKGIKNKNITAGIITILLLILIIVPIILIGNILRIEAIQLYNSIDIGQISNVIESSIEVELNENTKEKMVEIIQDLVNYIFKLVSGFVISIPQKIISFIILIFIFFYSLRDGSKIVSNIKNNLPLSIHNKHRVEEKIQNTITSLMYGEIAISIIQWLVATLGFFLMGVNSPGILGMLVGLVALLPAIGPAIVWAPLAIYFFLIGETFKAAIVALFGFIILTILLDAIVRAKILGIKGHIHPVIILIGVLGGLASFGLIGLIIGPVILVLLELMYEVYTESKAHTVK